MQVAILGAGPIGLDAALAASDHGWPFTVYEATPTVGGAVRAWGHVRMFTPWDMNVSSLMRAHLKAAGGAVPSGSAYPTGAQFAEALLDQVAALPALAGRIALGARVEGIGREGLLKHEEIATELRGQQPFRLLLSRTGGQTDGCEWITHADLVLDCTGSYGNPNLLGDGGIPAPGERALAERITRRLPDLNREREQWAGRRILLAGAGKSAQTAARDLAELVQSAPGTRVIWAVRSPKPDWGVVIDDPLPQRQELVEASKRLAAGEVPGLEVRAGVAVEALARCDGRVAVTLRTAAGPEEVVVDRVLSLTGYVGDASLYRQLQVHECYATAAPMQLSAALLGAAAGDCLQQASHGVDVLRSPEPNFFILGMKSYGRNSQFLLRIGYQQVDEVAAAYAT
jgi:cation diffusion facilitator CzcD-associated flavoprotein CzcO